MKHKFRTVVPSINVTFFPFYLSLLLTVSHSLFLSSFQAQIARRTWTSACQIHVKMAAYVETVTMATPATASQAIWGIIASWMSPSVTRVSKRKSYHREKAGMRLMGILASCLQAPVLAVNMAANVLKDADWSLAANVQPAGMDASARRRSMSAPHRHARMAASVWTNWPPTPAPVPWATRVSIARKRYSSVPTIPARTMPCV